MLAATRDASWLRARDSAMIVVDGGLALTVNDPTMLDMTLASPRARKSALTSVS